MLHLNRVGYKEKNKQIFIVKNELLHLNRVGYKVVNNKLVLLVVS